MQYDLNLVVAEFDAAILKLKGEKNTKYLEGLGNNPRDLTKLLAAIQFSLVQYTSSSLITFVNILVDYFGIALIIMDSFQELAGMIGNLMYNEPVSIAVSQLAHTVLGKFDPMLNVSTPELQTIFRMQFKAKVDAKAIPIQRSPTDQLYITAIMMIKELIKKKVVLQRKDRLKKLKSIIEEDEENGEDSSLEYSFEKDLEDADLQVKLSKSSEGLVELANAMEPSKIIRQDSQADRNSEKLELYSQVLEIMQAVQQFRRKRRLNQLEQILLRNLEKNMDQLKTSFEAAFSDQQAQFIAKQQSFVKQPAPLQAEKIQINSLTSLELAQLIAPQDQCEFLNLQFPLVNSLQVDQLIYAVLSLINASGGYILIGVSEFNGIVHGVRLNSADAFLATRKNISDSIGLIYPRLTDFKMDFIPMKSQAQIISNLFVVRITLQQGQQIDRLYTFQSPFDNLVKSALKVNKTITVYKYPEIMDLEHKFYLQPRAKASQIQTTNPDAPETTNTNPEVNVDYRNSLNKFLKSSQKVDTQKAKKSVHFNREIPLRQSVKPEAKTQLPTLTLKFIGNTPESQLLSLATKICFDGGADSKTISLRIVNSTTMTVTFKWDTVLENVAKYIQGQLGKQGNKKPEFIILKEALLGEKVIVNSIEPPQSPNKTKVIDPNILQSPGNIGFFIRVFNFSLALKLNLVQLLHTMIAQRDLRVVKFSQDFSESLIIEFGDSKDISSFFRGIDLNRQTFKQFRKSETDRLTVGVATHKIMLPLLPPQVVELLKKDLQALITEDQGQLILRGSSVRNAAAIYDHLMMKVRYLPELQRVEPKWMIIDARIIT